MRILWPSKAIESAFCCSCDSMMSGDFNSQKAEKVHNLDLYSVCMSVEQTSDILLDKSGKSRPRQCVGNG